MRRVLTVVAQLTAMSAFGMALAVALPRADSKVVTVTSGAEDYRQYCAPCHGARGRGDGVLVPHLETHPSDLAELARRNGGLYPAARVFHAVDARNPTKAHGSMPSWGEAFRDAAEKGGDAAVATRIRAIVDHVGSFQLKAPEALALCVLANEGVAGPCTETATLDGTLSVSAACGAILACLNDPQCGRTYCQGTSMRHGWRLESSRRATVQP